tara:strand:+ start:346 stop:1008 length:663 start_codon:yes stop_codon:yes gene_type:complete
MKKILICGYRDWAYDIFKNIELTFDGQKELVYIDETEDFDLLVDKINPEIIFFIGWSWIIDEKIIKKYKCICLHPSPLPKYRGGSPLQHQILNGEQESAVTLFQMDTGIDTGDILYQEKFSLDGDLSQIFLRIVKLGSDGVSKIIENDYQIKKQNNQKATSFKRRKSKQSEITITDLKKYTAKQIHNKIRALQEPYPNAFIKCKDGSKLFLLKSKVGENK